MRRVTALISLLAFFALPAAAHGTVATGKFGVLHKDGFGKGPTEFDYMLKQGDRTTEVLPTQLGSAGHGDRVEVRGQEEDGRLVGKVAATNSAADAALGQHTLAVVLLNWTGDQREPWTPAEARQQIFDGGSSMNAFYKEESYDQISFTGDVLGWYTIDQPSSCSYWNYWQAPAFDAAAAEGVDLNAYEHVMFVFPPTDCPWGGVAFMPGPYSWINGTLAPQTTVHEMGHNLGLNHANGYTCTSGGSPVTIGDTCTSMEYGDPFDVMGSSTNHNSGWHLQKLGALAPSNVKTITESGSYTMRSALTQTSDPTTLRIPRTHGPGGSVLDYYYVEVRPSGGVFDYFHPLMPGTGGVHIRLNDDPSVMTQSRLLDSNPGSSWYHSDAPFQPGSSFSDGSVGVSVTSVAGDEATVAITVPDPPDTQAPTVPTGLTASATADGAELSWTASTDATGVASYAVYRDGTEIGTSSTTTFTDTTAAPGAHAYVVAAEDAAHNRSAMSAPATVNVPTPPSPPPSPGSGPAPGRSSGSNGGSGRPRANEVKPDRRAPRIRIRRKRSRSGRVTIRIRATDARGVARIELFIRGKRRKTVRLSGSRLAGTLRYVARIPRGARAVARATDRSGNRSRVAFRLPR